MLVYDIYKLNKGEISDIIMNWQFTKHATIRITERMDCVTFHEAKSKLITRILNENFGYYNTDNYINLAVTETTYLVFAPNEKGYLAITYKEDSQSGFTIYDKYHMALEGLVYNDK